MFGSITNETIAANAGKTYQDVTALRDPLAGLTGGTENPFDTSAAGTVPTADYSPSQPRDEHGRWSNEGGKAACKGKNDSDCTYHAGLKGVVTPTSKMVEDIPLIKLPGMTDEQALSLQKSHRAVLQAVIDSKTPDHEAGCYILSDYSSTMPFVSDSQGNADFPEAPENAIGTIHSHPSGSTFSVRDITNFASNGDLSIMTVVGNNGKVYVFQKTELFDVSGYVKYLNEQYTIYPDYKETAETYIAFMEEILNGAPKYGFNYSAY